MADLVYLAARADESRKLASQTDDPETAAALNELAAMYDSQRLTESVRMFGWVGERSSDAYLFHDDD